MDKHGKSDLRLPSPPHALARVIEAASDPSVTAPTLGKLVGSDPAFAASLLKMANSSIYNRGTKISSAGRAVSMMGSRVLRNLALCAAVRNCVHRRELGDFNLTRFWEESLRRAVAARVLAERAKHSGIDPTEAFTGGLLQDLGVLALVRTNPELGGRWQESATMHASERLAAEHDLFGRAHVGIADPLIAEWNLPDELAMPMRFHHEPGDAPGDFRQRCQIAANAELLASVLSADDKKVALERVRIQLPATADLDKSDVDEILNTIGQQVTDLGAELGFRVGTQPSYEEILHSANIGLVELNMSYEDLVQKLEQTISEKEELAKELEKRNRELEQLSLTDELTKLPNRRALSGRMSYELKKAARSGGLCFVVGDLDKFKSVNDTWGHEFGDLVLENAAEAMIAAVRDTDMVARIGGEEFGIVMPDTDLHGGMICAERIVEAVRARVLTTPDGQQRGFTISLGLAHIEGPYTQRVQVEKVASRLYKTADAALYTSKENGRNRVTSAGSSVPWAAAAGASSKAAA